METPDASPAVEAEECERLDRKVKDDTRVPALRMKCFGCGNEEVWGNLYECNTHLLCESCAVLWQSVTGWS